MSTTTPALDRRNFIKLAMVGGAAALGAQALPKTEHSDAVGNSPYHWAMVIDLEKCIGCDYCTMACKANNDVAPNVAWNKVFETGEVDGKMRYMPVPCQHCEHAPCVDACPVKATYHRADGLVAMDYERCIGCRYCEVACPYGVRTFNWKTFDGENPLVPQWGTPEIERRPRGVVEKCSFCAHRIDRGLAQGLMPGVDEAATPACVVACPTGARVFGDLNDPESEVSKLLKEYVVTRLREDLGTETRVYYIHAHFDNNAEEVCE